MNNTACPPGNELDGRIWEEMPPFGGGRLRGYHVTGEI